MLFKGQKVILKHTGDLAVVQQIAGDGMVMVMIEFENMVIPVAEEDLLPADGSASNASSAHINVPKSIPPEINVNTEAVQQEIGLQLGFEAIYTGESIEKYQMYLINNTDTGLLFVYKILNNGNSFSEADGVIKEMSLSFLGEISYEKMASTPEINIEVRSISTMGLGSTLAKSIKIKPASFFKSIAVAPLLNREVHLFLLFKNFNAEENKNKKESEDIQSYTSRLITPNQKRKTLGTHISHQKNHRNETVELAHFSHEIDLHIENLSDKYHKMSNGEIIQLQLRHFENYLDKAVRLGVERIFIIHGLGKGTLRETIAERLSRDPRVDRFSNKYHPKYGFGATEVVLL